MSQHNTSPHDQSALCEVWLDLECGHEIVCTVFGRQAFSSRPVIGEALSFMPPKGSTGAFSISMAWGAMPSTSVSAEVDSISHYRGPLAESQEFITSVRCSPLRFPSLQDARAAAQFLVSQHGFEIDPYAVNKLSHGEA